MQRIFFNLASAKYPLAKKTIAGIFYAHQNSFFHGNLTLCYQKHKIIGI